MTTTIPQDMMTTICVRTYGFDTIGSTAFGTGGDPNTIVGLKITVTEWIDATTLGVHILSITDGVMVKLGLYSDNNDVPGTLLAMTDSFPAFQGVIEEEPLISSIVLEPGTYWVAFIAANTYNLGIQNDTSPVTYFKSLYQHDSFNLPSTHPGVPPTIINDVSANPNTLFVRGECVTPPTTESTTTESTTVVPTTTESTTTLPPDEYDRILKYWQIVLDGFC
jgi:hypothetical protein